MQTINELLEDNTFCGESLKRHCEAIIKYRKQTGGKKTLKRIIAAAVFEDSDTKADTNTKNLSSAFVFDKNNPLLTFGDKTRQEMLQDIRRIYADDIMAIGNSMPLYAESPLVLKSHFLFKQYFMTDADENTVAAGELRLFYTSEYGAITYESFTLHIAEGKNYDAFDLEGTIKRYGTTLVLNSDFPTYFGTTIIQTDDAFFAIGPQPDLATLYHGSYLTYSKANETIEGNILLAAQPIDAVIAHYDTPPHIAQYLFNTFKKLSPPAYNNQLPETKQKQALQTSPPPAFLVGTYKQFFIHATERAISVSIVKIHADGTVDYHSTRSHFKGIIVAATSNVYQIQYNPYPSGVYEVLLTFSIQTTPSGDLRSLKACNAGISRGTAPFSQRAILYPLPLGSPSKSTRYPLPSNSQNPSEQAEYTKDLLDLHHEYPAAFSFLIGQDTHVFSVEKAILDEIAAFLKA